MNQQPNDTFRIKLNGEDISFLVIHIEDKKVSLYSKDMGWFDIERPLWDKMNVPIELWIGEKPNEGKSESPVPPS